MYVLIHTLGCKVNQYESQVISESFRSMGIIPISVMHSVPRDIKSAAAANDTDGNVPDICVINSCTVTRTSDRKTRQAIARLRRLYPDAVIVLTGCFPQAYPENAAEIPGVDIITGTAERSKIAKLAVEFLNNRTHTTNGNNISKNLNRAIKHNLNLPDTFEDMRLSSFTGHTRAFVKIQDGCDRYCAYCAIPYARGNLRSKSINDLERELNGLALAGFSETVLVGINLSNYGKISGSDKNSDLSIADAIRTACEIQGIERVRLGSLEPDMMSGELIDLMSGFEKLCPHFHLSLQSGCDSTLRRMKRHYTTSDFALVAERLRASFENCAITTDIIVGFPGESENEFYSSLEFVKKIGFSKAHIFPYSDRPGTAAMSMPDKIIKKTKTERAAIMTGETEKSRQIFLSSQVGRNAKVLFETSGKGYTENYTPVEIAAQKELTGKIYDVMITGTNGDNCTGRLL
ncbi:MAG: tRNA (N(6)-L-threonylcarbamoyladenosine(37)-C(2))-methylthiotransferase MtaB [Oscillospiraceae bacterium]|nr:tRNA (N(6)-L-threonylcarbamoyladenosine(37)-C(2))-methylthiotransferase MtaB [Oscillospiraceae bacterium]